MAQAVERYFENGNMPQSKTNIVLTQLRPEINEEEKGVADLQRRLNDKQRLKYVNERQEMVQSPNFACQLPNGDAMNANEAKKVLNRVLKEKQLPNLNAIKLLETINKNLGGTGQNLTILEANVVAGASS